MAVIPSYCFTIQEIMADKDEACISFNLSYLDRRNRDYVVSKLH